MTTTVPATVERQPWHLVDPSYLQLILLVTEQCNFRCTYCYETFANLGMREPVILGVSRLLERRGSSGLRNLEGSWFGGEPLLEYGTVLRVSSLAQSIAVENGINYRGDMTTNASLLSTLRLRELVDAGCRRFQVTLDGAPQTHDLFRVTKSGHGTSRRLIANVRDALASDIAFELLLRIHVHPGTAQHLDSLIALLKEFNADRRVTLLLRPISNLGGPNEDAIRAPSDAQFREVQRLLHDALDGQGNPTINPFDEDSPHAMTCYAARANSFVIRSDGRVGKCTVALDDERNTVGQLREDGTMMLDANRVRPWIRGITSGDLEEMNCPLIGLPRP